MSSDIFAKLTTKEPTLQNAGKHLDQWLNSQPEELHQEFFLSWPTRELSDRISSSEMAGIVSLLSKEPKIKILYRVEDPEGNAVGRYYDDVVSIPNEMCDLSGNWFHVNLKNVQQVVRIE